jgi:HPt (histidine-containing phosphotransfer) domain-containing protein
MSSSDKEQYLQKLHEHKDSIFAGSKHLMKECVDMFLQTYENHIEKIESCIHRADFLGLKDAVHKYKGSLKLFTDGVILDVCKKLEQIAQTQNNSKLEEFFQELMTENILLCQALQEYSDENFKGII